MQLARVGFWCIAASVLACAVPAAAQEVAHATVHVQVDVAPRTSLRVSSQMLQFEVPEGGGVATAAVDFSAGARLSHGGNMILSVEPLRALDGPGGAADVETELTFAGEGDGLLAGPLKSADGTVVGRWTGSGRHEGRVVFTLRARAAGSYAIPVRFVLSAP